jgi:hypothetical protein
MKNKLLKKIRRAYCIEMEFNYATEKRMYTIYDRFSPNRRIYLHDFTPHMYIYLIKPFYGFMTANRIIDKHEEKVRVRKLRKQAIQDGYTFKQLPWMDKK